MAMEQTLDASPRIRDEPELELRGTEMERNCLVDADGESPSSPTIAAETERLSHSAWGKWLWANLSFRSGDGAWASG